MWGFAVSWWVFVSNFVFWTVGWTRDGGGRRHAGLRHTVINIFHHFWPFIDWTTNQYIMKVIIRLIDNSSRCCHRRLVVGDGQTAVQLLSSLCLNLQSVEWGSACLSTSGFHWAAQLRNSPPAACWVWGGALIMRLSDWSWCHTWCSLCLVFIIKNRSTMSYLLLCLFEITLCWRWSEWSVSVVPSGGKNMNCMQCVFTVNRFSSLETRNRETGSQLISYFMDRTWICTFLIIKSNS